MRFSAICALMFAGVAGAGDCRNHTIITHHTPHVPTITTPPTAPVVLKPVHLVPVAFYTVPGPSTVTLNIYPSNVTYIQPVVALPPQEKK